MKKTTTFVICDNCGHKFNSPIQVGNLKTNPVLGNKTICPKCKKETLVENRNMVNE